MEELKMAIKWKKRNQTKGEDVVQEEIMIEALQQLVREFEEKMTVIIQQQVMESEDLKKEVRELRQTCETLRAEKAKLWDQNLKLKDGIKRASQNMKDSLQAIFEEANEPAVNVNYSGPKEAGAQEPEIPFQW